jgi:hypothetical protein
VRLGFSADGVVLEAGGADDAQASEQLECVWEGEAGGEPFQIAFNPAYLLDGLSAVDSDTTTLSFTGPDAAGGADRQARRRRGAGVPGRLPLPAHAGAPVRLSAAAAWQRPRTTPDRADDDRRSAWARWA